MFPAVNINTTLNAGGEIRGQVVFMDQLTSVRFATLSGGSQVPGNPSMASGTAVMGVSADGTYGVLACSFANLANLTLLHIHGPADRLSTGPVLTTLPPRSFAYHVFPISGWGSSLSGGMTYVNAHTTAYVHLTLCYVSSVLCYD